MNKDKRINVINDSAKYPHLPGICIFANDREHMKIKVVNEDCLTVAKTLNNPLVLVMGSKTTPGGEVHTVVRGQEEDIFRRTNLATIIPTLQYEYPLTNDNKGIYCFDVDVFLDTEENDYTPIDIFNIATFIIPALNRNSDDRYHPEYYNKMEERITTICEAAKLYRHKNLVLGPFGCGRAGNNPTRIAAIFESVLHRYSNYFDNVIFACKCDQDNIENYNVFKTMLTLEK